MVARIRVWARDQTDKVTNATVIPSSQWGGAGRDVLLAGQGDDTLTGGPEPDFLSAGGGNDLILARDDADDNVVCGGGDRDKAQLDPLPLDDRVSDCETKARH
jgi:Ca2+-binding RTX toxin-like protein